MKVKEVLARAVPAAALAFSLVHPDVVGAWAGCAQYCNPPDSGPPGCVGTAGGRNGLWCTTDYGGCHLDGSLVCALS